MVKRIGVNTKTKLFIALASLIWGHRGTKNRIKMWSQLGSALNFTGVQYRVFYGQKS